jgi:hypothetical protein
MDSRNLSALSYVKRFTLYGYQNFFKGDWRLLGSRHFPANAAILDLNSRWDSSKNVE